MKSDIALTQKPLTSFYQRYESGAFSRFRGEVAMSENIKTYMSFGIALTSAAIYCFALGYLNYFQIIDYPSWFNSHVFFFSNALSKSSSALNGGIFNFDISDEKWSALLGTASAAIAALTTMIMQTYNALKEKIKFDLATKEFEKQRLIIKLQKEHFDKITAESLNDQVTEDYSKLLKQLENFTELSKGSKWLGSVGIAVVVTAFFLFIFKEAFLFVAPVLITPLFSLFLAKLILEWIEKRSAAVKETAKRTNIDEIALILVVFTISWILPYDVGHKTAESLSPIKSFPSAWSGGEFGSSDYLVWKEDDRGFWINCKERVIYGITNDGHMYFSRDIGSLLKDIKCE